jgi:VWFA-related protein
MICILRVALAGGWLTMVLAFAAYGAQALQKPFVDRTKEELVRTIPELADLEFDTNQDNLEGLLQAAGDNIEKLLAKFVDLSAAEDIHEMRFEDNMTGTSVRESFRYAVKVLQRGGAEQFDEFRVDPVTNIPVSPPAHSDFLVIGHFVKLLNYFAPQYRDQSRFRYLGRAKSDEGDCFVVAFAQHPEATELRSHIRTGPNGQTARLQGVAWIDAAAKRVVRLRLDLLEPVKGFPLETVTTDISWVPVSFPSIGSMLLLPAKVTVDARYAGGELHTVHRYSAYRAETDKTAGLAAVAAAGGEDSYELLTRGIALSKEGKSVDEIAILRDALRLNPAMAPARFYLANALRAAGDLPGAEAELREAVKVAPDSAVVHNLLGVVLSRRGDLPGAVAEFRTSTQLQPKEAIAHVNLAQALEKSGDRAAAIEEYRTASQLAPDNADFKARYEQLAHAPTSPATDTTIKVDVRQVLVPVVVTDKEGHHVTGLTRADFQVFEDGVEQKISGFNVEDAGLTAPADATGAVSVAEPATTETPAAAPPSPKPVPARRTYLVCIDSMHGAFGNLVRVREALSKLFRSEQPGDSRYAVLAIGTSTQVVQDTTPDPEKALEAIGSKNFQKMFLASRKSSMETDLLDFRRALDSVRAACDAGQPECMLKRQLPSQADRIAQEDRTYAAAFLSQFQSAVKELSRTTGRRTIVFISDGFLMVPGKLAYELLVAYFPEFQSMALRTVERTQELDPILRLAANSNIPIYTVDSRGLYTSTYFDASNPGGASRLMPAVLSAMNSDASEAGSTLSEIAAATGGTSFQNSNDLLSGLQRAFADGRQYYMLAYVPGSANPDGKFHAISVRLRDQKLVVKAKRGYWAVAN